MIDSLFLIKKLVIFLLSPSAFLFVCLLFALLAAFFHHQRSMRFCLGLFFMGLLACSFYPISGSALHYWEQQYPYLNEAPAETDIIVVLGGAHYDEYDAPAHLQLKANSQARVVEAVRLWRQWPDMKILLSGGKQPHSHSLHADRLADFALSLGVPEQQLIRSPFGHDTASEAEAIAELYSNDMLVLVSDAAHLPRAMKLFWQAGLKVVAAPAYYQTHQWNVQLSFKQFLPHFANIALAETAIRETVGNWWVDLGGK